MASENKPISRRGKAPFNISALTARAKKELRHQEQETNFTRRQEREIQILQDHAAELRLTTNIPQFIIKNYMHRMGRTAWGLFTYLCCCATFDPRHKDFGTYRTTHEKISQATGIAKSEMRHYEKEIENVGLLRTKVIRTGEGTGIVTIHHYEITFFKIREGFI